MKLSKGFEKKSEKREENGAIDLASYKKRFLNILRKGVSDIAVVSKSLNISKENVYKLRDMLCEAGYAVFIDEKTKQISLLIGEAAKLTPLPIKLIRNSIKIGLVGDTEIGDVHEQIGVLEHLYRVFKEEGVQFVIHTGNVIKGSVAKIKENQLIPGYADIEMQIERVRKHYPKSDDFKTYFIGGYNEYKSCREGLDIIGEICKDRADLVARGYGSDMFVIRNVRIKIVHSLRKIISHPLTVSTRPEKIAKKIKAEILPELNKGDAKNVPQMAIVGRWLTSLAIPTKYKIPVISVPCLRDSSPEEEDITVTKGALILELFFDKDGNFDSEKPYTLHDLPLEWLIKQNDYLLAVEETHAFTKLSKHEQEMLKILEESPYGTKSKGELSRRLNVSTDFVVNLCEKLEKRGYNLTISSKSLITLQRSLKNKFKAPSLNDADKEKESIAVASVSDSHLCSRYQQLTLFWKIYDLAVGRHKAEFMLHAGDVIDGPGFKHQREAGKKNEVLIDGSSNQLLYAVKVYPKKEVNGKPFMTHMIGGQHDELWWEESNGFRILEHLVEKRPEIKYYPGRFAYVESRGFRFVLNHPDGAASAILSSTAQKLIDRLTSQDICLPHLVCFGNYHQAFYVRIGTIGVYYLPCLQEQTDSYLKHKILYPDIGCWMMEIVKNKTGNVLKITSIYYDLRKKTKKNDYDPDDLFKFGK